MDRHLLGGNMSSKKNAIAKISETGSIFSITWPIFIELLLQFLVGSADQIMVSQYSENSVGAIGNANQILNLLILLFSIVSMASTILISQYNGAGKKKEADEIYTLSIFVNLMFSLFISMLLLFGSHMIFGLLHVPAEMMDDTCRYASIIGSCMFLTSLYQTFTAFFRSNAMMKVTMFVSVIVNIVNIGGNYVLINGLFGLPALGVTGAAISSNLSRLAGLLVLIFLFHRLIDVKIMPRFLFPFPMAQFRRMMRIGLPAGGENISYNISQIAIQGICNLFPLYVINTRIYANTFATFSFVFAMAIAQATQIQVGYLMGARRVEQADRRVMNTLRLAVISTFTIAVLLFLASRQIFGLVTDDAQVLALGSQIMMIEIILEIGRPANIVLVCALQAAGDVKFPTFLSVVDVWCVAVAGTWLLGIVAGLGLAGVWAAMAADECVRGVILLVRWKRGKWKAKNILS